MSITERSMTPGLSPCALATKLSGHAGLYRLPVYCACSLLAVVITFLLGKDLPPDALDYHLYAGFSALHDRFAQDYFAAGPRSYFTPYAYVPFYALVRAGLSSLEIAAIAALAQSAILWLTYELALCCCSVEPPRRQVMLGLCAVIWALANPILIGQFGSSFTDITTAELILGGWLLLARAVSAPRLSQVLWAGVIVGAATALKLTNAVYALSAFVLLLFMPVAWWGRVRWSLGYAVALGAGFAAVTVPWGYRLEQQFGNPLFPLLNGWFRSPEFVTGRLINYRFIPDSFTAALWRPFAIVKPVFMIQEEMRAPDMRYALLLLLVIVLVAYQLVRRWLHAANGNDQNAAGPSVRSDRRVLAALGCALIVAWVAWLTASGNGRYFIPMACVTAVVTMVLLFRLFARHRKVLGYLVAAILTVQGTQLAMGAAYRWDAGRWDDHWLDIVVPPKLAHQPNLYFTMSFESDPFLAAYLPAGSGFIDVAGGYPLSPTGISGRRIAALVRRYSPDLRMLVAGTQLYENDKFGSPRRSDVNTMLAPFGLRVDSSDCQTIVLRNLQEDQRVHYKWIQTPTSHDGLHLLSCHLVPGGSMPAEQLRQQRDADTVLDRLEEACPRLFQPRGVRSQVFGRGWMRYYLDTDEVAWVSRGQVKFDDPITGDGVAYLGAEADWLSSPQRVVCGHHEGHYYARLLPGKAARVRRSP